MNIQDIFEKALTLEQCEKLPTPRLLAYYKKHRWLENYGRCDCCGEFLDEDDAKQNKVTQTYHSAIQNILNTREHVK